MIVVIALLAVAIVVTLWREVHLVGVEADDRNSGSGRDACWTPSSNFNFPQDTNLVGRESKSRGRPFVSVATLLRRRRGPAGNLHTFNGLPAAAYTCASAEGAEAVQHTDDDLADEFKGLQPFGLGARQRFVRGGFDLVSHASEDSERADQACSRIRRTKLK